MRFVGAKGCEVIVSGKLRAQRAKSMKFKDGYMVSSGNPVNEYIDAATRHVMLRQVSMDPSPCRTMCMRFCSFFRMFVYYQLQGVLGIKVRIMKEWDPTGKVGPRTPLPDVVTVLAPKVCKYAMLSRAQAALPLPRAVAVLLVFSYYSLLTLTSPPTVLHRICVV